MEKRTGIITFAGGPLTLVGKEIKVGDQAPQFKVLDQNLNVVTLDQFAGKKKIISVVPSIDTGVCDQQTRHFNEEAAKLDNTVILTVSMDLPFAQARYCGAAGIDAVVMLSDHKDADFGKNYGVLIEELRLLARSIFVLNEKDEVIYTELVSEVTNHPDYEKALAAAK